MKVLECILFYMQCHTPGGCVMVLYWALLRGMCWIHIKYLFIDFEIPLRVSFINIMSICQYHIYNEVNVEESQIPQQFCNFFWDLRPSMILTKAPSMKRIRFCLIISLIVLGGSSCPEQAVVTGS